MVLPEVVMKTRYSLACELIRQLDITRLLGHLGMPISQPTLIATEDLMREWDGLPPIWHGAGQSHPRNSK